MKFSDFIIGLLFFIAALLFSGLLLGWDNEAPICVPSAEKIYFAGGISGQLMLCAWIVWILPIIKKLKKDSNK